MKTKTILQIALLLFLITSPNLAFSQSKKEIVKKGIVEVKTYKQDLDVGEKQFSVDKIEYYDINGELVEYKDYTDNGKSIKEWVKYTYDAEGNCIEEVEYDTRGRLKKKTVTTYENGLKVLREYYDYKERLIRKRKYEYQYSE